MRIIKKAEADYVKVEMREDGPHLIVTLKNVEYEEVPDEPMDLEKRMRE